MHDPSGPTWSERAARHPDTLPYAQRKLHGTWFTPMTLALPTARRTLAPLLAGDDSGERPLRICDPAVGGGTFLLAALAALRERGAARRARLTGLDIDAEAARLAALALHEAGDAAHVDVRRGDGLLELAPESFDCVVTNPPWETLQTGPDAAARVAALRPHFRHQGRGKLFTYRLFVERAVRLLRPGGRLGLIVPSSLWCDRDAEPLRRLLLDACEWQWLYGFENRAKVFAIDGRYRFGVVVATKGGATRRVQVAFGRVDVADWAANDPAHVAYERGELRALSPGSGAFVEVEQRRDLDVLRRMHARGQPLCGDRAAFAWRQGDFNMTADRDRFVLREHAERAGYARGDDAVWRCAGNVDLLPLYQGAMIHDLQPNAGAHAGGVGHKTAWEPPTTPDELRPLYLVAAREWRSTALRRSRARIVLRALSNATNERTAIACLLPDVPCGNSLGVLEPRLLGDRPLRELAWGAAVLGSLPFDWALRLRLGGTNLNGFVLADCVLPVLDDDDADRLARAALALCAILPWHTELWDRAHAEGWCGDAAPARDVASRRRLQTTIDVAVGRAFGLSPDDVAWLTRGCDDPPDPSFAKGFWRVDRDLPPAERRPNRWRCAAAAAPPPDRS